MTVCLKGIQCTLAMPVVRMIFTFRYFASGTVESAGSTTKSSRVLTLIARLTIVRRAKLKDPEGFNFNQYLIRG